MIYINNSIEIIAKILNTLLYYTPNVQEIWGFPMYPGGHLHDGI